MHVLRLPKSNPSVEGAPPSELFERLEEAIQSSKDLLDAEQAAHSEELIMHENDVRKMLSELARKRRLVLEKQNELCQLEIQADAAEKQAVIGRSKQSVEMSAVRAERELKEHDDVVRETIAARLQEEMVACHNFIKPFSKLKIKIQPELCTTQVQKEVEQRRESPRQKQERYGQFAATRAQFLWTQKKRNRASAFIQSRWRQRRASQVDDPLPGTSQSAPPQLPNLNLPQALLAPPQHVLHGEASPVVGEASPVMGELV